MLEVTHLIRQQETVRHELVIDWEEPLKPAYDHTKDILLGEVIHQWVSIEDTLAHLDNVEIVVP